MRKNIGAVHSIIFGGFSPDSIATRINDCESNYLITADEGVRGGKIIPKKIADEALSQCPDVKKCVKFKELVIKLIGMMKETFLIKK